MWIVKVSLFGLERTWLVQFSPIAVSWQIWCVVSFFLKTGSVSYQTTPVTIILREHCSQPLLFNLLLFLWILLVVKNLGVDNTISCDCKPDFSKGVRAKISCEYDNTYCFIPEFCATPTFEGDYGFQGSSYTEVCYDVTGQAQQFLKDLCFKGRHSVVRNLRFADCTASYGGDACGCEVCSGGLTAKIDCSAVNGPSIPCASLGI